MDSCAEPLCFYFQIVRIREVSLESDSELLPKESVGKTKAIPSKQLPEPPLRSIVFVDQIRSLNLEVLSLREKERDVLSWKLYSCIGNELLLLK